MSEHPIETEIKLRLNTTPADASGLIQRSGFSLLHPRTLQIDQIFDRPTGDLRAARSLLRVRSMNGRSTLTYKGPPLASVHYKSREELEASTADNAALLAILQRLGFVATFRYEKYRTTFAHPGEPGVIALDETPMGVFLELEGPEAWIDAAASTLGFAKTHYLTLSYATLYRQHRELHGGPPDMIFSGANKGIGKEP